MSVKRQIEHLNDITDEIDSTDIHFGVEILSPVKKAKSGVDYFNGQVTDGSSTVRIVGFDATSQAQLSEFAKQKTPVKASNCAIRRNRTNQLEIHVNKGTKFTASQRKLDFKYVDDQQSTSLLSISDLQTTGVGTFIYLVAKVTKAAPAKTVSTNNVVQEIELQDITGIITLSVWNNNVDKFHESTTYHFTNLLVRTYRNMKTLTFNNYSLYVEANPSDNSTEFPTKKDKIAYSIVQLTGIQAFNIHYWCICCNTKLTVDNITLTQCTSCKTLQFISSCKYQITSKFVFSTRPDTPDASPSQIIQILSASTDIFIKLFNMVVNPEEHALIMPEADRIVLQACRTKTFNASHTEDTILDIKVNTTEH